MRSKILAGILFFLFIILIVGLISVQIVNTELYRKLSEKNRVRILPLEAPRGKIYDRKGNLLVTNRISFDVAVIFREITDEKKTLDVLRGILGTDRNLLSKKMDDARQLPFIPVKIAEDIEKEKAIRLEEVKLNLPGVIVTTRPMRDYLYKNMLSHVTGYLGEISEQELVKYGTYGYRMKDFVGKDGIERSYNDYLRGTRGGLQVEVDSRGRQLGLLAVKEPLPGRDLYLTINAELQSFCDSLMDEREGAIVAMDPRTGAVLALVSHPDFNPNIFVSRNNFKEISPLLNNSESFPMLDRAISGTYSLGSVFKIVVSAAVLDLGLFNEEKNLSCNGSLGVGNRIFHCWKEKGHGSQNIIEAIKHSCNVFFYQLGILAGPVELAKYAFKFGLGQPTGIDLPGEASGFVPTPSWKRKKLKSQWFKGETANYAIGQGYLLVTPIQVVRMVSVIANDGKLVQPFLVERIEDLELRHGRAQNIGLKEKTLKVIKEGLRSVVNAKHGTGFYTRSKDIVISGKTGTAQNPKGKSHAWFTGFAPFEDPAISIVVFVEHGGKGGEDPARFAKKIMEKAKELELL